MGSLIAKIGADPSPVGVEGLRAQVERGVSEMELEGGGNQERRTPDGGPAFAGGRPFFRHLADGDFVIGVQREDVFLALVFAPTDAAAHVQADPGDGTDVRVQQMDV